MKTKNFPLRLDEMEHKELKLFCVEKGISMQEFIVKAMRKELGKLDLRSTKAV